MRSLSYKGLFGECNVVSYIFDSQTHGKESEKSAHDYAYDTTYS